MHVTHTHTHTHSRTLAHARTHIHSHTHAHSHMHARTYIHTHARTHAWTHTLSHTDTHNHSTRYCVQFTTWAACKKTGASLWTHAQSPSHSNLSEWLQADVSNALKIQLRRRRKPISVSTKQMDSTVEPFCHCAHWAVAQIEPCTSICRQEKCRAHLAVVYSNSVSCMRWSKS